MFQRRLLAFATTIVLASSAMPLATLPVSAHGSTFDAPQGWFGTLTVDDHQHYETTTLLPPRSEVYDQRGLMTIHVNGHGEAVAADVIYQVTDAVNWQITIGFNDDGTPIIADCSSFAIADFSGTVTPPFPFGLTPPPGDGGLYNLSSSQVLAVFETAESTDISGPPDCGSDFTATGTGGVLWQPSTPDGVAAPDGWDTLTGEDCDGDCEPTGDDYYYVRTTWSLQMADLAVSVRKASDVPEGVDTRLLIDVQNQGPVASRDLYLDEVVPVADVVALEPGVFSCTSAGSDITCTLSELAPNETRRITVDLASPLSEGFGRACVTGFGDRDASNSCSDVLDVVSCDLFDTDYDDDGIPDEFDSDDDDDGISDLVEMNSLTGTDPCDEDSDDDELLDGVEDANHDGIWDEGSETHPRRLDTDGDELSDGDEDANHNGSVDSGETDPRKWDTDGDTWGDGDEVAAGSDPLDPNSTPGGGHNEPPVARLSIEPIDYTEPTFVVHADCSRSSDNDGQVVSCAFRFDGGPESVVGPSEQVSFAFPGPPAEHVITVTIADDDGAVASDVVAVTGNPVIDFAPTVWIHRDEGHFPASAGWLIDRAELGYSNAGGCPDSHFSGPIDWASLGSGGYSIRRVELSKKLSCKALPKKNTVDSNDYTRPWGSDLDGDGVEELRVDHAGRLLLGNEGFFLDFTSEAVRGIAPDPLSSFYDGTPFYTEYSAGHFIGYWFSWGNSQPGGGAIPQVEHQGDWEHVAVRLNPTTNVPILVRYYFHHWACDVPWTGDLDLLSCMSELPTDVPATTLDREYGLHSVVFAAREGHGSYWSTACDFRVEAGISPRGRTHDECEAGYRWSPWLTPAALVDARTQPWYGFGGAWGKVGSAPPYPGDLTGPPGPGWNQPAPIGW